MALRMLKLHSVLSVILSITLRWPDKKVTAISQILLLHFNKKKNYTLIDFTKICLFISNVFLILLQE